MEIIRFTAPFKPEGAWAYSRIALWNRYLRSKLLLLMVFVPSAAAIYFLYTTTWTIFSWILILVACYPLLNLLQFLVQIRNHLRLRDPADTAETEFTLMHNGILVEQKSIDRLNLLHWDAFTQMYDWKEYFLLFHQDRLVLLFDKRFMEPGQEDNIRIYVHDHIPAKSKGKKQHRP